MWRQNNRVNAAHGANIINSGNAPYVRGLLAK